jgi:hypothetical protein
VRRGTALPIVLFALAMTSALVVSGAFVTRQRILTQRMTERGGSLEPACERALVDVEAHWDSVARAMQPVGTTVEVALLDASDTPTRVWASRVSERIYWLVAEARDESTPPVRRRIGVVIRVSRGTPGVVPERGWSELP